MKCSKAKELLSAELDGELSSGEELALTRHLAKCAACTQEKAELSSLRGTMSLWADEEPSEWLAQSFSYKLKDIMNEGKVQAPKPVRRRWSIFGPATAGVVTAMLLVVIALHNQQQPLKTPEIPVKAPVASNPQPVDKPHVKQSQPAIAANSDTAPAPKMTPYTAPNTGATRRSYHQPAVHVVRPQTHLDTVATVPAPAPPAVTKSIQPEAMTESRGDQFPDLMSRGAATPYTAPKAVTEVTIVGSSKPSGEETVKDNIGEAGLAMNENVEKLRGKLQEAVDLLVSKPPMPVKTTTDPNGGSQP